MMAMLALISRLIEELNARQVSYCHWKSNLALGEALTGRTDIDLLIDRRDSSQFRVILSELDFRPAAPTAGEAFPAMEHYFGLDEQTGVLAHVHAYYRAITGESLTKNYRIPVEQMLLSNTRQIDSVRVPTKGAELVVFTLRMMLKHTSVVELALLARDRKVAQREMKWLLEQDAWDEALDLVNRWLPTVEQTTFSQCVSALQGPDSFTSLLRRILLARRLMSQVKIYARRSSIRSGLGGVSKFTSMFLGRVTGSRKRMVFQAGGAVIAFVGPEATGKSTHVAEISRWLGEHFVVAEIHAGTPRSTAPTVLPNTLLPLLRSLLPRYRSGNVEAQYITAEKSNRPQAPYPIIFGIRSVLLAYDRWSLLTSAYRAASNGTIVLSDRYPCLRPGAPDSPQLTHLPLAQNQDAFRRLLTRIEARLYRAIPGPDLVVRLCVPLEVAIRRNETRSKREPDQFVRLRHAQSACLEFGETPVVSINTEQALETTVLEAKKAIWQVWGRERSSGREDLELVFSAKNGEK